MKLPMDAIAIQSAAASYKQQHGGVGRRGVGDPDDGWRRSTGRTCGAWKYRLVG